MTKKSLFGVILVICLFFVVGSVLANPATWAKETALEDWAATFTTSPTFTSNASVKTSDGGMITVGSFRGIKLITGEYKRLFALKTDSFGNQLWCKLYNLTDSNYGNDFYACTELPNGNIVIVGRRTWSLEGGKGIMLEINSSGDIQTALEFPGAFTFKCIKTTSDGGLIIAGMEGFYNSSYPVVYKLSANFTVEWKSVIEDSNAYVGEDCICEIPSEGYFLATSSGGIIELNFDGTAQWKKTFHMGISFLYDSSVYALSNGNLMLVGYYLGYSHYGTLNQIDPDGVPVWTKCRYFNKSNKPKTFTETADGEFIVGGPSYYTGSLMWFSRLHSDGSTDWIRKYANTYGVPFFFMGEGENSIFAVGSGSAGAWRSILNVKTDQTGAIGEACNFLFEENPAGFNLNTYEGSTTIVSSYDVSGLIDLETAPQDSNEQLAITAESVTMETTTTYETKAVLEVQFDDTKGLNVTGELLSDSSVVIDCGDGINDCSEELSDGTQVRLSATAKPGYVLDYWDDGVSTCVYSNPMITTVSNDVVWTPVFSETPIYSPVLPVNGDIALDYKAYTTWRPVTPHNGIDYSSNLSNIIKAAGKGIVHSYTKVDASSFGAIGPDMDGPAIWIRHMLSSGEPVYILYGHTASSWVDNSYYDGGNFFFNCSYTISLQTGYEVNAGDTIGYSAPFYHSGELQTHLHLSVFKPKKKEDGTYYGPPNSGWGYSDLTLPTGNYIDPKVFFSNYHLSDDVE